MLMIKIMFVLLLVTAFGQTYSKRERNNPYEIFTSPLDNQLQERTSKVSKILFITSWNPQGHYYALKYAHKFSTLIICWYDLNLLSDGYILTQQQPFDQSFIPLIKKANPNIKVLLRIYLTNSARQVFEYIGGNDIKTLKIAKGILQTVRKVKANGIYYDSPFDTPHLNRNDQPNSKYDSLAIACSIYLANLMKQHMNADQIMLYGLKNGGYGDLKIDLKMMSKIKTDGFVVAALQNSHYEELAFYALEIIGNLRRIHSDSKYYMLLPFFSRRSGIGMATVDVKKLLEKKGVAYRGIKNGVCFFIEYQSAATSYVPCYYYFHKMLQHAQNYNLGVAFYEAGEALQKYFQFL